MSFNAVLKIPFVVVSIICTQICLTPPNPPAKDQEKSKFSSDAVTNEDVIPMPTITKTSIVSMV